jgi:hypothetical protein
MWPDSSVTTLTRLPSGRLAIEVRISVGADIFLISKAYKPFYPTCIGFSFTKVPSDRVENLIAHLLTVPQLRMLGSITPPPTYVFRS